MTDITLADLEAPVPAVSNGMPLTMAIMLNDRLFERTKLIATYLSKAQGFVPPHLIGKPEACFAVVMTALTWKLNPFMVAKSTYSTPGGNVGYEGKLCQAILENSGRLEGNVKFEHYGDWSKVQGKFEVRKGNSGKDFAAATWGRKDAEGLGVVVRAKVKGEENPREWRFDLIQAFPLNSTLWATDPKTQICYTAVRRFASVAAPGLFMGVPFEGDDDPAIYAKDITDANPPPPRPTREQFREPAAAVDATVTDVPVDDTQGDADEDAADPLALIDEHGEIVREFTSGAEWLTWFRDQMEKAGNKLAVWEANEQQFDRIRLMVEDGSEALDGIHAEYFSQQQEDAPADPAALAIAEAEAAARRGTAALNEWWNGAGKRLVEGTDMAKRVFAGPHRKRLEEIAAGADQARGAK